MQVQKHNRQESSCEPAARWRAFFILAMRVLAVGLLASGLVTWVAANWEGLSRFQRLAGAQILLVLVVLAALFLWWRAAGRRDATQDSSAVGMPACAGALFLASVVTGGLLALLGQTYQTGADPWTLFGWWALLMLPWLWATRSWFVAILWVVVANAALVLFLGQASQSWFWASPLLVLSLPWVVALVNIALLALAEGLRRHYDDPLRAVPRVLALIALAALGVSFAHAIGRLFGDSDTQSLVLNAAAIGALLAAAHVVYGRYRPDFFILALLAGATVLLAGAFTFVFIGFHTEELVGTIFLTALVVILTMVGYARALQARRGRTGDSPAATPSSPSGAGDGPAPVSGQAASALPDHAGQILPASRDGATAGLAGRSGMAMAVLSIFGSGVLFLLAVGLFLYFDVKLHSAGAVLAVIGLAGFALARKPYATQTACLVFAGLLLLATYPLQRLGYSDAPDLDRLWLFGLGLAYLALYHFSPANWFRFVAAMAGLTLLAMALPQVPYPDVSAVTSAAGIGYAARTDALGLWAFLTQEAPVYLIVGMLLLSRSRDRTARYRPMGWALLLIPLGASFILAKSWDHFTLGTVQPQAVTQLLTAHWALPTDYPVAYLANIVYVLLPVAVALLASRHAGIARAERLVVAFVLLVLGVLWSGMIGVQIALLLGVLGFALRYRSILAVGVISLIVFLAKFYYQLHLSLLDKAYFLLAQGACLMVLAVLWHRFANRPHTDHPLDAASARPRRADMRLAAVLLGLVAVLAAANLDIVGKERILREGRRFVVALTPVDPRSLMQGDYMSLNFGSDFFRSREDDRASGRYVELAPDAGGVFQFIRIRPDAAPTSQPGNVVVRFRWLEYGQVLFVTDAYFFAEGRGEHFAQARFGEFRVNENGEALLTGLLDEKKNRL